MTNEPTIGSEDEAREIARAEKLDMAATSKSECESHFRRFDHSVSFNDGTIGEPEVEMVRLAFRAAASGFDHAAEALEMGADDEDVYQVVGEILEVLEDNSDPRGAESSLISGVQNLVEAAGQYYIPAIQVGLLKSAALALRAVTLS